MAKVWEQFEKLNWELWVALISLILVLLPGILVKVIGYDPTGAKAPNPILTSVGFMNSTLIIGLILGLYSLVRAKDTNTRSLAILTMIVCVVRLVLSA